MFLAFFKTNCIEFINISIYINAIHRIHKNNGSQIRAITKKIHINEDKGVLFPSHQC